METLALQFADAYGSFSPGIDETDIAKMLSTFEGIFDAGCEEIQEGDSAAGIAAVSYLITFKGYCTGTTIGVSTTGKSPMEKVEHTSSLPKTVNLK